MFVKVLPTGSLVSLAGSYYLPSMRRKLTQLGVDSSNISLKSTKEALDCKVLAKR